MTIRELKKNEITEALDLAWAVFNEFEAPDYSEEGVTEFNRSIHDPKFLSMLRVYGAFEKEKIVGTIATCGDGSHIALFFVSKDFQRQGIGRALFSEVCHDNTCKKISVNSSPFAVPVYHHFGFTDLDVEQVTNGLRYTPMVYKFENKKEQA